jgi:hypothetical protein
MEGAISAPWARVVRIYILREKSEKPYQFLSCHPRSLLRHKLSNHKQLLSLKIQKTPYSLVRMICISRRESLGICCKQENNKTVFEIQFMYVYTPTSKFICCTCSSTAWSDTPMTFAMKITVLWSVALCVLVDKYHRFRGA